MNDAAFPELLLPMPDAAPAIDRECMAEMWEDAGPALFRRLAEIFTREREARCEGLLTALFDNDRTALSHEAHGLKTAAAYICANHLRDAAARLEVGAAGADMVELADMVHAVNTESNAAAAALAAAFA